MSSLRPNRPTPPPARPRRRALGDIIDPANLPPTQTPAPAPTRVFPPILKTPRPRAATSSNATPAVQSDEPTLRGLRVAFQETPIHLRELETGWRERRRERLSPRAVRAVLPTTAMGTRGVAGVKACVRCGRCEVCGIAGPSSRPDGYAEAAVAPPRSTATRGPAQAAENTVSRVFPSLPPMPTQVHPVRVNEALAQPYARPSLRRPPTPPSSPPPRPVPARASYVDAASARLPISGPRATPRRISCSPLPPTARPVPLHKTSTGTIHVHAPPNEWAITIALPSRNIRVARSGGLMEIHEPGKTGTARDGQTTPRSSSTRILDLGQAQGWTAVERGEWAAVKQVLERFKRCMPHAKVYTPMGELVQTCSSPPDVVLSYTALSEVHGKTHVSPAAASIKVRVTLSRIANELALDTATTPALGEGNIERFRSRRIIRLRASETAPTMTSPRDGRAAAVHTSARGSRPSLEDALGGLGLAGRDAGQTATLAVVELWTEEEREAVRRLWALRGDWARYG